jgi:CRP/FNR family transcriptional regulator
LLQGLVALTAAGAKDQPIGVEVIAPCEPFGLLAVVNRIPFPLSALALSPLVVLELPAGTMIELVEKHHELKSQLLSMAAARFREARHVIHTLSGASARSRLAYALTLLAHRIGNGDSEGCTLSISRKQLAQLAGTTVETCIRELKQMEHEGLLTFPKFRVVEIKDLRTLHSLAA